MTQAGDRTSLSMKPAKVMMHTRIKASNGLDGAIKEIWAYLIQ